MNLKYKYWYFTGALSSKFCDDVIKLALSKKIKRAGTRSIEKTNNLSRTKLKDLKNFHRIVYAPSNTLHFRILLLIIYQ